MDSRYDIKIYKPDGREGPTIRGLTYTQQWALGGALTLYNIQYSIKGYYIPIEKGGDINEETL